MKKKANARISFLENCSDASHGSKIIVMILLLALPFFCISLVTGYNEKLISQRSEL